MHDEAYVARQQANNGRNSYYPGQFSFTSNRSIVAARSFREHMAFACSGVAGREIAKMITFRRTEIEFDEASSSS